MRASFCFLSIYTLCTLCYCCFALDYTLSFSLLLFYRYQIIAVVNSVALLLFFVVVSVLRHRCKSRYIFVNFVLLFLFLINFCTFSQLKCNSIKVFSVFLLGSFFRIHTHSQVSTLTRTHTRRNTTRITSKRAVVVVALTVTCE